LKEEMKLPKGEALQVQYRAVVYQGTPEEIDLKKLYSEWASTGKSSSQ